VTGSKGGQVSTPDYTRWQGFLGAAGPREMQKTLEKPGFSYAFCFMKPLL
jgi:hypothetical protein